MNPIRCQETAGHPDELFTRGLPIASCIAVVKAVSEFRVFSRTSGDFTGLEIRHDRKCFAFGGPRVEDRRFGHDGVLRTQRQLGLSAGQAHEEPEEGD